MPREHPVGNESLFNKRWWKTGKTHAEQWRQTPISQESQKSTENRSKTLTKGLDTIKENIGKKLVDIGLGSGTFGHDAKAQKAKAEISKWDCLKSNASAQQEKTNKMKR